jgi:hypothetical protein
MTSRDRSRLYRLATGLYARSQSSYEQWQALSSDERQGYIDAASAMRAQAGDVSDQSAADRPQST